jgi:putative hydrolase of HD superfamily
MSDLLEALLALVPLESLPRTGWVQHGITAPESVAGHVLGVGFVALALAPKVTPPVDVDRVVALTTVHDAPEALLGDLPRAASELLPAGAKAAAEVGAAERLLGPLSGVAADRYREAVELKTREARLAKLCDRLQLGVRLLAYHRAGWLGLGSFLGTLAELDCSEFPPAVQLQKDLLRSLGKPST